MQAGSRIVEDAVRALASEAVRREGADLVEVEFRREPVGWVLRLYVDKQGGVGLDDCRRISEVVGTLIEVEDAVPHAYTLEVSSPGLTRPLLVPADWHRAVGSLVKVVTKQALGGKQDFVGRLLQVGPEEVRIELDGNEIVVPFVLVARARREVEWPGRGMAASGGRQRRGKRGRAEK